MIFTIMNREDVPLLKRGYRISEEHATITDRKIYNAIVNEKGMSYANELLKNFSDREPICLGEDGVFYTVLFDTVSVDGDEPVPCAIAWHEIEVIPVIIK